MLRLAHWAFLLARRYASACISCRRVSVCLSVRLSCTGIVSKRLIIESRTIALGL